MADELSLQQQLDVANQLQGTRDQARLDKLSSDNPQERGIAAKSIGEDKAAGIYSDRQARVSAKGEALEQADQSGESLSYAQRAILLAKRRAEARKQKALKDVQAKNAATEYARYMQNPIGTPTYLAFLGVAIVQDGLPALFDLALGVGWVIGYMLLPFTWACYLYLIVRRVPASLRRKFIFRTALLSAAALIPYVGEIMPEWIATTAGSWLLLRRYEAGIGGVENVSAAAGKVSGATEKTASLTS